MSPIRMARLESAVRLVLEFNEAFNRGDVAGMMRLVCEDCVFENAVPGPEGSTEEVRPLAITELGNDARIG